MRPIFDKKKVNNLYSLATHKYVALPSLKSTVLDVEAQNTIRKLLRIFLISFFSFPLQNQSDSSWHLHHLLYESEATLKDYTQVSL